MLHELMAAVQQQTSSTDSNSAAIIWVAVVTGVFGVIITWQNTRTQRKIKTNHGKTIGTHVEEAARDAKLAVEAASAAKYQAELLALQLAAYKSHQELIDQKMEAGLLTLDDALKAHAELDLAYQGKNDENAKQLADLVRFEAAAIRENSSRESQAIQAHGDTVVVKGEEGDE